MFAPADQTQFSITFDGLESDFQVLAFTGIEGISQPYRFEIDLVSERPDVDIETFLHQQAFFALDANGSGIHGQVYQIAQGDNGKRLHRYKVVLTPQLVYLAHRINQRIYQQMSAPKIIALILEEHGILGNAYQFQLSAPCPDRD